MKKTEVISIDPNYPEAAVIGRAAELLLGGGLVAFPTETVYGLGANALDAAAVRAIFAAKGRPAHNPLIVHVASAEVAQLLCGHWPENAQRLAAAFWPGSLTLVLPRRELIPDMVTAGGPTVALRVPAHPVALALIAAAGVPLAAPSANRSNQLSPTRAEHVRMDLDGRVDLILDGGPAWGGLESTVVDLTQQPPQLLRPGLVAPGEIEAVIGAIVRLGTKPPKKVGDAPVRSPGLLAKHYAPRAALECVKGSGWDRVRQLAEQGGRIGWLRFTVAPASVPANIMALTLDNDPRRASASLFAQLHALDGAGVQHIVAELPPDTDEWLAIRDRLLRAASS